jgi:hypothetical protein
MNYDNSEWQSISKVKNWIKDLSDRVQGAGHDPEVVADLLKRGVGNYFYHVWALHVHRYYSDRSTPEKRWELSKPSFEREIKRYIIMEEYLLSEQRAVGKKWER